LRFSAQRQVLGFAVYINIFWAVVKVRRARGLSPLLRFEPPAVNEKVLFYVM